MGNRGRSSDRKLDKSSSSKRRSKRKSDDSESDSYDLDSRNSSPPPTSRKRMGGLGSSRSNDRNRRRDSDEDHSNDSDESDGGDRKKIRSCSHGVSLDPEEDRAILERRRMAVLEEQQRRIQEALMATKPAAPPEDNFELKASKAMGTMEKGDAVFGSGAEVNLDSQVYWWYDKYRPRKPKYFNRVRTGYEWNKYNQTHYDHDNPPPKLVQGYKFNIFYPDLIDKTKTPTYTIPLRRMETVVRHVS